jgi:uncharacterized protein (DUF934 family)
MRRILRRREIVADDWRDFGAESTQTDSIIVPLPELRRNADYWHAWRGQLGLRIAPPDRVEDFADEVARFALIAVEFSGPTEGRGYTQGRLLRERFGFAGELRAVGVKRDQLFLLARCGFDSFDLAAGEDLEAAAHALNRYTVAYQPGARQPSIARQRFST